MDLTDSELMCLVGLVNRHFDQFGPHIGHTSWSPGNKRRLFEADAGSIVKKLLQEAESRGIINRPSCFKET